MLELKHVRDDVDQEEMRLTHHSEQKRKVICSRGFFCSSLSADGEDMMSLAMRRGGLLRL